MKYTLPFKESDKEVKMKLFGHIGADGPQNKPFVDGAEFADEMYQHNDAGRKITIRINSMGGSVYDTYNVIQAIRDTEADTHIVGIAGSAAGIAAQFGKVKTANDFSSWMAHPPTGNNKKLIENVTRDLTEILVNNTDLSEEEVKEIMKPGGEKWMRSDEMLKKKVVDKVIQTGKKNIFGKDASNWENIYEICNELGDDIETAKKPKKNIMSENIAKSLKIDNNADEAAILVKIAELRNVETAKIGLEAKVANLEAEKAALTAKVAELEGVKASNEAKLKEAATKAATDLVENAIASKKIKIEAKQNWLDMAISNYEQTKDALNSIEGTPVYNSAFSAANAGKSDASSLPLPGGVTDVVDFVQNHSAELAMMDNATQERIFAEYEKKLTAKK